MVQFRGFETKDAALRFQEANGGYFCFEERKPKKGGKLTTRGECYMEAVVEGLDLELYPYCVEWVGEKDVEMGPEPGSIFDDFEDREWRIAYRLCGEMVMINDWMIVQAVRSAEAIESAMETLRREAARWPVAWKILDVQIVD